jgi:acyl carrier protein
MDEKTYTDEQILSSVKETIGKILMISPDEIEADSSLVNDLGMESIDFLDVAFRLEEGYNIELPRKNPVQRFIKEYGRENFVKDNGEITVKGLVYLRHVFSETDPARISEGLRADEIMGLVSVQTYVSVVKRGLEIAGWNPDRCGSCGGTEIARMDKEELELADSEEPPMGPVFKCTSCGSVIRAPSFDEKILSEIS